MQRTVSNYKCSILTMKTDIDKILGKVNYFHSNHRKALNRGIEKQEKRLYQILAIFLQKKYKSDHVDVKESSTPSLRNSSTENGDFRKENINIKVVTKEDLIKNVNIPSHEP